MTRALDRLTIALLSAAVCFLAYKLLAKGDSPRNDSPETEAYAEHLGSIDNQLHELSKLRRSKRLGGHNG